MLLPAAFHLTTSEAVPHVAEGRVFLTTPQALVSAGGGSGSSGTSGSSSGSGSGSGGGCIALAMFREMLTSLCVGLLHPGLDDLLLGASGATSASSSSSSSSSSSGGGGGGMKDAVLADMKAMNDSYVSSLGATSCLLPPQVEAALFLPCNRVRGPLCVVSLCLCLLLCSSGAFICCLSLSTRREPR